VFKFINVLTACCLATSLLAACGQKGDLYLPSTVTTEPAAPSDNAGEVGDQNDDDDAEAD